MVAGVRIYYSTGTHSGLFLQNFRKEPISFVRETRRLYATDAGHPRTIFDLITQGDNKMKATWNGAILAESNNTIVVEGNQYFPADSINNEFFQPSETHTVCGWKGTASYYDVVVNGETNKDAAWYYPETKPDAKNIEGYVAFWKGVVVG